MDGVTVSGAAMTAPGSEECASPSARTGLRQRRAEAGSPVGTEVSWAQCSAGLPGAWLRGGPRRRCRVLSGRPSALSLASLAHQVQATSSAAIPARPPALGCQLRGAGRWHPYGELRGEAHAAGAGAQVGQVAAHQPALPDVPAGLPSLTAPHRGRLLPREETHLQSENRQTLRTAAQ